MKRALRGLLLLRKTFLQLGHAKLVLYCYNLKGEKREQCKNNDGT